jgi:tRNA(His) guanylyltransferase
MKLGDRIKRYEAVTHYTATGRTPLMVRVDGRAFHTFTRGMDRPFDQKLTDAMVGAAKCVAEEMQGFKAAYIQSDEATFCLTDYDRVESQGWFDYDLSKVISISAALMTAHFIRLLRTEKTPVFDSRAFMIPANDVVNAFLWRAKDWERNSLQMYSRAHYSHKELHGKGKQAMHDLLHEAGKNWATDLTPQQKNGTFLIATDEGITERHDIMPTYGSVDGAIGGLFVYP